MSWILIDFEDYYDKEEEKGNDYFTTTYKEAMEKIKKLTDELNSTNDPEKDNR